jgi:hypothetical protein
MATNDLRGWYDDASVVAIVLMVLIVALILYGTVVLRETLAAVALAAPLVALYLLWRVAVAAERIADATELLAAEGLDGDGDGD